MQSIENLIVGAGPAGLAVAARLRKHQLPFKIIEQQNTLAYSWKNHYDRLQLHTVKQLSALPYFPFPDDYPVYVPRKKVVDYLENYATRFNIEPIYDTSLKKLERENDQWLVHTNKAIPYKAKNVVLTTGINRIPNIPTWHHQHLFKGEIMHSKGYKNPEPYLEKKVLVVGMGNTGAEVAFDLAEHKIDVTIAVRSPVSVLPRDVFGNPVQLTAKKLAKFPFGLGDWLGSQIRKIVIGDLSKYGLQVSKVHPTVQLRETGKTPILDIGTVKAIKADNIKVKGDINALYEEGVIFKDGTKQAFDQIILATGYKARLEEFIPDIASFLDKYQLPKSPIGSGPLQNLYFVGFDNYKLGGILGIIQTESEEVVNTVSKLSKP